MEGFELNFSIKEQCPKTIISKSLSFRLYLGQTRSSLLPNFSCHPVESFFNFDVYCEEVRSPLKHVCASVDLTTCRMRPGS